ncbi:hypothetical protein ASG29_05685 [Sphingomonas sp. Leaf412]|nr:hypothetical protein ASG29_05685 [Sphingomonas sp. Leaf412]
MRRGAAIAGLLVVAACSGGDDPSTVLSPNEDRQLNRAAEMLDANSVALEDVTDNIGDPRP